MVVHEVRVHPSSAQLPRQAQLTWKMAELAAAAPPPTPEVAEMVTCRAIDNAGVALASIDRRPVATARVMALAHPRAGGATLFGLPPDVRVHAEWAAWANATAVRELDFHDCAPPAAHPGDNIAPLIAVAQQMGCDGAALVRAIAVAYEIQVALGRGIPLAPTQKEQTGHLCPATTAGLGALLRLPVATIYQALNQAVLISQSTRQTRKGEMTSWKAFVPGHSGKLAIDAVDRAMRGEASPSPAYEGESGAIAYMLGGPDACYHVSLPAPGEPLGAILQTFTKAHAAVNHAQAFIDLAFELRAGVDLTRVREVVVRTNSAVHNIVGSGANDPEKSSPDASRETLDHSLSYLVTVALEDGWFHHERSYAHERAHRPGTIALWRKVRSVADPFWDAQYRQARPERPALGGRLELHLVDGRVIAGEKPVADAQIGGARTMDRTGYEQKFRALAGPVVDAEVLEAFLALTHQLSSASPEAVCRLNPPCKVRPDRPDGKGIYDHAVTDSSTDIGRNTS
ncbi:MAG: MmgE/PrpD family protein [Betaproteobacteria bacterium]|nr:MmgE/PrpD family protein [Betaproteobacteria bacterium]